MRGRRHVEIGREEGSQLFGRRLRKTLELPIGLEHRLEPRLESCLGGLHRHAGLQAAEHVHPSCAAIEQTVPAGRHLPLHHRRDPQRRRFADVNPTETWLRNADYGHRLVVDQDLAPDDIRCAAEGVGPVIVRDDDDRVGVADEIVRFGDEATEVRPDAEHGEIRARHDFRQHRLMLPSRRQVHRRRMPAQDAVEELRLRLQIAAHRVGHQVATAPAVRERIASPVDQHDAVRIPDRKQSQQHLIDERKDGGVGADAEREGQDRRQREGGRPYQRADGVSAVAAAVLEPTVEPSH